MSTRENVRLIARCSLFMAHNGESLQHYSKLSKKLPSVAFSTSEPVASLGASESFGSSEILFLEAGTKS